MSFWGRVGTFWFLSSGSLSWAPGVRESGPCRLLDPPLWESDLLADLFRAVPASPLLSASFSLALCEPDLPESGLEPASLLPSSSLPLLLDEPDLLESDFERGLDFLEPDLFLELDFSLEPDSFLEPDSVLELGLLSSDPSLLPPSPL